VDSPPFPTAHPFQATRALVVMGVREQSCLVQLRSQEEVFVRDVHIVHREKEDAGTGSEQEFWILSWQTRCPKVGRSGFNGKR